MADLLVPWYGCIYIEWIHVSSKPLPVRNKNAWRRGGAPVDKQYVELQTLGQNPRGGTS